MRRTGPSIVALALLGGLVGLGTGASPASAACNVKGQYCNYPAWAANAFSAPRDRVPDWVLIDNERYYKGETRKAHRAYRHSSKRYR